MTLIVCLDNSDGLAFNDRRQSRDEAVIAQIMQYLVENDLMIYMRRYSEELFVGPTVQPWRICTSDMAALETIPDNGAFFMERFECIPMEMVSRIVVYRWNRDYPHDSAFCIGDVPWQEASSEWQKVSERDFAGKSHEKITEVRYERRTE